ncbi:MAG: hypothetical protein CBC38_07620 [Gammaproteobacteria bacterium TMED78]|nr:MAG: hypothetical protein CBC38_07620 [Gammaproteobacteria bacterium TMED78]|tara:strand:+ start:2460 stop:3521 length:1062 start_codon:yes stop_codon:yes gene_type:complete
MSFFLTQFLFYKFYLKKKKSIIYKFKPLFLNSLKILITMFLFAISACGSGSGSYSNSTNNVSDTNNGNGGSGTILATYNTSNIMCNLNGSGTNADESVNAEYDYTWTCSSSNRNLSANGIPNHEIGTFPNAHNPNTVAVVNINKSFNLTPQLLSNISGSSSQEPGIALNGVTFEPGTAGRCDDSGSCNLGMGTGNWNIEALGQTTFNFGDDMNNAHVQPNGQYHYHGVPERYVTQLGKGESMTLIGWAADGFPIYVRYGYAIADDSSSAIKILKSSWKVKSTGDAGRPSTNANNGNAITLGSFTQDYEYTEGLGDLDRCNGRTGVTPEFPSGIYYYVVTDDFPYASRCLRGSL